MADTETATRRVGQLIKARYRIERVLHAGAEVCVYAGTDTKLVPPTRVAIELLSAERGLEPVQRERFVQRGYLGNAVGHPGAVTALDAGATEDGACFLVLERLEAPSLLALRATHGGKLPLRLACAIVDQCLDLLACAHSQQIFHGAITPENLYWERGSQLRVLGFGSVPSETDPARARARDLEGVAALWRWLLGATSPIPASLQAVFEPPGADGWAGVEAEQLRRALARAHRAELGSRIEAGWTPAAAGEPPQSWLRVWLVAVGLAGVVLFLTTLGSEPAPRPAAQRARTGESEPAQEALGAEQTETGLAAATAEPANAAATEPAAAADSTPAAATSEPARSALPGDVHAPRVTPRGPSLPALRTPMLPEAGARDDQRTRRVPGARTGLVPLATAPRLCTELAARARRAPEQPLSDAEQRAWDEHCQKR